MTTTQTMARRHPLVVPVVLIATFVQLLDVTIVQIAIPSIHRELGAGQGALELVLAGYTLAYACTLIPAARLGDRYGYRRLFIAGMTVFTVFSAACAVAPTAGVLVVARVAQGIGSGLMAPQVFSIIQIAVPHTRRPHAVSLLGATMGGASLVGPSLGGLLIGADLFGLGWRTIFLVNIPVGVVALVGSARIPGARAAGRPRIDGFGAVLIAIGLGLLIFPLAMGREFGWPIWTWLCLIAAGVIMAVFVRAQRRHSEPLLHPSVFRDPTARTAVLLVFVFNAGVPSFTYLLLLYLQSGAGYTPIAAALTGAPYAAAAVLGSRGAPRLARRLGVRLLTVATGLLALDMLIIAIVIGSTATRWLVLPLLAVGGASFGAFTASVFSLALARVRPEATGSASGLLPTAQQLGGSIGVTLAGLVYFAPAAGPTAAFGHAMIYQAGIFVLAAVVSLWNPR